MHHWTVHEKVDFPKFPPDTWGGLFHNFLGGSWGVYSTTFDPELRNERFTVISFMGFPTILSTLQAFEIYIFNRK